MMLRGRMTVRPDWWLRRARSFTERRPRKERAHRVQDRMRALDRHGVPGAREPYELRAGDRRRHLLAVGGRTALVFFSDDHGDRRADAGEVGQQRAATRPRAERACGEARAEALELPRPRG